MEFWGALASVPLSLQPSRCATCRSPPSVRCPRCASRPSAAAPQASHVAHIEERRAEVARLRDEFDVVHRERDALETELRLRQVGARDRGGAREQHQQVSLMFRWHVRIGHSCPPILNQRIISALIGMAPEFMLVSYYSL